MLHVQGNVALGICPVIQEDGRFNVRLGEQLIVPGREMTLTQFDRKEIQAGGFGIVVVNLGWFRDHWKDPWPEDMSIHRGEDIALCLSVKRRKGTIISLAVRTAHASFDHRSIGS